MPRVWRIVKHRHAENAFDGEGARRNGGRWNGKGVPMVYCAESASLAVLEMLVHVGAASLLPAYSLATAEVADELIDRLGEDELPPAWRCSPPPSELQLLGDEWVASGRSAALAVPSVVVPWETNYLLNPAHPQFDAIRLETPRRFDLDERLAGR
jgi:RES domain-containing protein